MITYRGMTFCADQDCGTETCPRHRNHVPEELSIPVAWADFNVADDCPSFTNEHQHERRNPCKT